VKSIDIECEASELLSLLEELRSLPEGFQIQVDLPNDLSKLLSVESSSFVTSGASKLVVRFNPSSAFLDLMAAVRTRDGESEIVSD
jgi:hypothetical protein